MNNPKEELVLATMFCQHYQIEYSFISSLEESGLVELIIVNDQQFIPSGQLQQLEKIIRLHQELDINIYGLEVIVHMLQRMEQMQQELSVLKSRLSFYEE